MLGSLCAVVEGSNGEEKSGTNLTPGKAADPQTLKDRMICERGGRRAVQGY